MAWEAEGRGLRMCPGSGSWRAEPEEAEIKLAAAVLFGVASGRDANHKVRTSGRFLRTRSSKGPELLVEARASCRNCCWRRSMFWLWISWARSFQAEAWIAHDGTHCDAIRSSGTAAKVGGAGCDERSTGIAAAWANADITDARLFTDGPGIHVYERVDVDVTTQAAWADHGFRTSLRFKRR